VHGVVDRHAGLPADAAVRHDVHRRGNLRLLLDAEATEPADAAALDADQSKSVLPDDARGDAAHRRHLHPRHQHRVRVYLRSTC